MTRLTTIIATSVLAVVAVGTPLQRRTGGSVLEQPFAVDSFWNECDAGKISYTEYKGDGSVKAGWPAFEHWISYSNLWCINQEAIAKSCSQYYKLENNSEDEMTWIKDAISIVSQESKVDHRFILAMIVQESHGCVRAPTLREANGTFYTGLMQDLRGDYSCNMDGKPQNPCPRDTIINMVREGVRGSNDNDGHGIAEDINLSANITNIEVAQGYYRGAEQYSTGFIDSSNDLGKAGDERCYVIDVANRLMGWANAESKCKN